MTEFHKRSGKTRKKQQVQIEKHFSQRRTPEDNKRLKQRAAARKAEQRSGPRRRRWSPDEEDAETFEPMGRRPGGEAVPPGGAAARDGAAARGGAPPGPDPTGGPAHPGDRHATGAVSALPPGPGDDSAAAGRADRPGDNSAAARTDERALLGGTTGLGTTGLGTASGHGTSGRGAPVADTAPPDAHGLAVARLVGLGQGTARLASHDGRLLEAVLSASLAEVQQTALAVGDLVGWLDAGGVPRVVDVLPRRSELCRPDPGNVHRRRVLAANIDVAVLVVSVRRPRLRAGLIDRFLVALEGSGAAPVVVLNKVDLLEDDGARAELLQVLEPIAALGVPCLTASAESGEGLDALATLLAGRASVFVGHSGVGKSSLLNGLDPSGRRRTHDGRDGDGKGRHTTTGSSLTELPDGTLVIDTPGVRAFGLWDTDRASLRLAFPEFVAVQDGCRFRDCSHLVEPGCAVRAAVEAGEIAPARWQAYVRIHGSLER